MSPSPGFVWQPSLLGAGEAPAVDARFASLTRVDLDTESWVDHAPGWVSGSDALFGELVERLDWGQRSRKMYDREVTEPRLTSLWRKSSGSPLEPEILEEMRALLSQRYGIEFDSAGFNLYRDGRDSVAWHGDRIRKGIAEPLVALVSVGEPRRFLLKPREGGSSRAFMLGRGDLLVTGGRTQRTWLHSVPKVASAGPRISIAFRHGLDPTIYDNSDATSEGLSES
ncbi:MAG: alpha-ketoglutarate-dependent dioxygenase AlkB [Actinomycetota bacterium]|nr:alpha-ketoglutarate-dependent dioxygenase AlkB [Actinomycetota bacterium]